jgi:hypothetical protein
MKMAPWADSNLRLARPGVNAQSDHSGNFAIRPLSAASVSTNKIVAPGAKLQDNGENMSLNGDKEHPEPGRSQK